MYLRKIWWEGVKVGVPSLVSCLHLLIQYIPSCLPYLEGFPSICYQRIYHAMVTGTNIVIWFTSLFLIHLLCILYLTLYKLHICDTV